MKSKKLSLNNCTKTECKDCDFGYILKDFVKPIMQCLTNDIREYYMRLLTTKCLNQAILMAYFMLGKKGIEIGNYCDSNIVAERHKKGEVSNRNILNGLSKDILYKKCNYRYLYYILLTDTTFPHPDGRTRSFPGHVFIIEKIPSREKGVNPRYMFHQSYINQYDYKGHIERNKNTLSMSYESIEELMKQIHYIILNPTWDSHIVEYWKKFTFVNTSNLLESLSGGNIFVCYKKARIRDCINRLETYTNQKLKKISKIKPVEMNNIYGDASLYDSDQNPLTNSEMKINLTILQTRIHGSK